MKVRESLPWKLGATALVAAQIAATIGLQAAAVKVQAESGTRGAEYAVGTDCTVTYIHPTTTGAGSNPGSTARVATYSVTFPSAGSYDLYARIRAAGDRRVRRVVGLAEQLDRGAGRHVLHRQGRGGSFEMDTQTSSQVQGAAQ